MADALAELTRCTTWPRRMKNTTTGSQAAPVGSTITSKTVLAGAPASADCSIVSSPSSVGRHRRRASTAVVSSITTTVWLLVTPRSIPTIRRVVMVSSPFLRWAQPRRLRSSTATAPTGLARQPVTAPTHVFDRARPHGPTHLPIQVLRGRVGGGIHTSEARPVRRPQSSLSPPPEPAGASMQPRGPECPPGPEPAHMWLSWHRSG